MGPLTSALHRDRVLGYVERGARAGRRGAGRRQERPSGELARGCYVEPTIVRAKSPHDRVAQEEVFGPFVTVLTFKDDDEALAIANGTDYGLGSGLWTANLQRAHRLARETCTPAWCGSTATSASTPARRSAASARAATAARWASTRCASTRR